MDISNLYNNYNQHLRDRFGARIQKISINAGFTCPNRDGTKGVGGCTFCNNVSFSPDYCLPTKNVVAQMKEGIDFFSRYHGQKYLAYFQSFTNTYSSISTLKEYYESLFELDDVIGIVVATRPDCVTVEMLDYYQELSKEKYVMLEYGIESTLDKTLDRINRGHTYADSVWAVEETHKRNINVGAHLILGLPGETEKDFLLHAHNINKLPLDMIKLHQLQIVRGTLLEKQWNNGTADVVAFSMDNYIDLCIRFLEYLKPSIGIERFISQSPKNLLIYPDWGVKNFEFIAKLTKRMKELNTFQSRLYSLND